MAKTTRSNGETAVIHIAELAKEFGGARVVEEVTFDVPQGQIFGFIGPSGSGKTTTIRLLTGIYEPSAGQVRVLGVEPRRFTQATRARLGYLPQMFALYPTLTVAENLNFAASIYGMGLFRRKRLDQVLGFVELGGDRHKLARTISGGMQRRLSLAATLIHDPELLFLDEPTAGIDPLLRRKFWDHFRQLQAEGRTLFVTTQYVSEAEYCDRVGLMSEGRLLTVDTPRGLRRQAYGGELVDLRTTDRLDLATLEALRGLPSVGGISRVDATTVRLVIDDAATATPQLLDWCNAQSIRVEAIEVYLPPFDDVFVELVRHAHHHA